MKNFTLIELLVAVAIIGILVTILMPSLCKARKKAIEVVCLNNQCQLAKGSFVYSNDNNSTFPVSTGPWTGNWDVKTAGKPVTLGLLDHSITAAGDLFHCPLLDTSKRDRPYHNMNVQSHQWGGGMVRFKRATSGRVIIGYSIRTIGWLAVYGQTMKTSDDSSSILIHDVFDKRVGIRYHHKDNYNIIRMDGSGVKYHDKNLVLDNRVPGRFDGGGAPGRENNIYQWLQEQIN